MCNCLSLEPQRTHWAVLWNTEEQRVRWEQTRPGLLSQHTATLCALLIMEMTRKKNWLLNHMIILMSLEKAITPAWSQFVSLYMSTNSFAIYNSQEVMATAQDDVEPWLRRPLISKADLELQETWVLHIGRYWTVELQTVLWSPEWSTPAENTVRTPQLLLAPVTNDALEISLHHSLCPSLPEFVDRLLIWIPTLSATYLKGRPSFDQNPDGELALGTICHLYPGVASVSSTSSTVSPTSKRRPLLPERHVHPTTKWCFSSQGSYLNYRVKGIVGVICEGESPETKMG